MSVAVEAGPLHRTAPEWGDTLGAVAAEVGSDLGFDLDADQRWSLDAIFAENDDDTPVCGEYCVVGPRQTTGKSVTLEVAAVVDVFVLGFPLHVWTAHEFKTARKTYLDLKKRLSAHPDYASRCDFRDSHGEEAILLDTGEAIEFHARSGGSGRGFTTSRITLDEWLFGQAGDLDAMVPTGVTIPDFQVRYASSAGIPKSTALRSLRARGRRGDPSLAYLEHGAPRAACGSGERCGHDVDDESCAINDRDLWRQANSGLRIGRVAEIDLVKQRRILAGNPLGFAREFLSWWEDPPHEDDDGLDYKRWRDLADPLAERGRRVAFGVATAPDRAWSAVAVAWHRPDGAAQVMLAGDEHVAGYRPGADWVTERVADLKRRWRGRVYVNTAARDLVPKAVELSEEQQARAHNAFALAIDRGEVRHGNDAALNTAVRSSQWKNRGSSRILERRGDVDISPADAAAIALHGLSGAVDPLRQIW